VWIGWVDPCCCSASPPRQARDKRHSRIQEGEEEETDPLDYLVSWSALRVNPGTWVVGALAKFRVVVCLGTEG
jgi:hypothetical protein